MLASRYQGSTIGVTGALVVFDQQEVRRNVASFSDLYVLDRRTGRTRALTRESRLQDPDVAPDGQSVVAVRGRADGELAHPGPREDLLRDDRARHELMQISRAIAGFSPARADDLRKAVGKKDAELIREEIDKWGKLVRASGARAD